MIRPLQYVSKIRPYVPGKPIRELERELGIKESIKLASNENPLGPSPKALAALKDYMNGEYDLHRYPDGSGYYLKEALAGRLSAQDRGNGTVKVSPDNLILGNGSNELLDIAVRTYIGAGDEAVMAAPSFVVYAMAVNSVGGVSREVPLSGYRHDLARMADAITSRTKMVFVANPNNPTGTINRQAEFAELMSRVPEGVLVVLDEAYYEYVQDREYPDTLSYFGGGRDVLILRTFSKAYGLAALRIGYGITTSDIAAEMNKIREPFNTGSVAQLAALHALDDSAHLRGTMAMNEQGKSYLYGEFDRLGLPYVPTEANFIYMPLQESSQKFYDGLLRQGVIVRPVGPKEIRVTIGLPAENERLVSALEKMVQAHA